MTVQNATVRVYLNSESGFFAVMLMETGAAELPVLPFLFRSRHLSVCFFQLFLGFCHVPAAAGNPLCC
jgi:hypothetical protein